MTPTCYFFTLRPCDDLADRVTRIRIFAIVRAIVCLAHSQPSLHTGLTTLPWYRDPPDQRDETLISTLP